eukprot:COSAG02_NODE_8243_length_2644_cov_9.099018_1_plen_157_part_00
MSSIQNKRANLQPAKHLYCNSGLICRVFPEYARTVRTRLVYEISSGFEPNRFGSRIEEIRLISEIHEQIQMAQTPLFREVRTLVWENRKTSSMMSRIFAEDGKMAQPPPNLAQISRILPGYCIILNLGCLDLAALACGASAGRACCASVRCRCATG